jgi:hypothetical protein
VWCGVDNIHIYRTTQLMLQNHIRYAILRYAKPFNAYGRRGVSVIAERYFLCVSGSVGLFTICACRRRVSTPNLVLVRNTDLVPTLNLDLGRSRCLRTTRRTP